MIRSFKPFECNTAKVFIVISDLNPIGGAQNIVANMAIALSKSYNVNLVIVSIGKLHGPLSDAIIRDSVPILRLNLWVFLSLIFKAFFSRSVFHFHLSRSLYLSLLVPSIRKIYTEHSTFNKRRSNIFLSNFEKIFLYGFLNRVVCISEACRLEARKHVLRSTNLLTIPNACSPKFSLRSHSLESISRDRYNEISTRGTLKIVMTGRAAPSKDHLTLIRAISTHSSCHLFLIGVSYLDNQIHRFIDDLGLNSSITLCGPLDSGSIYNILLTSHIYVQSSNWEGFGLSALEAMSLALPTIASNVPGLNELVPSDYLFTVGDYLSLSSLITTVSSDYESYTTASNACYNKSKHYSFDAYCRSHVNLYHSLLL